MNVALLAAAVAIASAPSSPRTLRALYGLAPPAEIDAARTALILVDFQEEFRSGGLILPDVEDAVRHAAELLAWARAHGVTVVHVRNVTRPGSRLFAPDSPSTRIMPELAPIAGERVVTKSMAGGFSRSDLDAGLRTGGIRRLVIAGLMAHLAVDTTARDGAVLGYDVIVASDATATRDLPGIDRATLQRATLAALADRFADVMTSNQLILLPLR